MFHDWRRLTKQLLEDNHHRSCLRLSGDVESLGGEKVLGARTLCSSTLGGTEQYNFEVASLLVL